MKNISTLRKAITTAFSALALIAVAAIALPQQASALTSAGATIHNAVTVSFTSGATTLNSTTSVNVAVSTLASAPNITVDQTAVTSLAGSSNTFTYTVTSTSNGPDTYTPALAGTTADTNVSAATNTLGGAFTLWGGYVISTTVDGEVNIAAGAETGLVVGATVMLDGYAYTVGTITAGTAASTAAASGAATAGTTTAETYTTVALAPIAASPVITAAATNFDGLQMGEYTTFTNVQDPVGTPTTPGTDGTHTVNVTVTTTATLADNATAASTTTSTGNGNETVTTVSSPNLSIVKKSRNVTTAGAFAANGTTAKPGEVLEYEITVTNPHASASATSVSISDVIPAYTSIVTGAYNTGADEVSITETINGVAQATAFATAAAADDVATLAAGTLTVNIGVGATSGAGGTITGHAAANSDTVVILYQVTVQ
ncbi:MAG: hypothetical protein COW62_06630 [Zetaproteobacteria bacterium CG17_big_fil_post_rev_8_21_14_2_50_50_13]|nr:MAG: hypothetical protein COW62_06630 [Zetaproteobacteria bacterium CG17_big_fil_post_rev_8_21_14_2_50_50_13]PIY56482.1 MAG: hypothetical protein COZ00_03925 [Zetaproteobacteria bacterium CG_4_10_14_0_8_um_filter_49_80]